MKRIIRSAITVLTVFAVLMSLAMPMFAADSTVTFKGKDAGFEFAPGSEYTATDLFDNFKGVMPGDVLTETITVTNVSEDSDYIKLYVRAAVHGEENPLSTGVEETGETVATMTDFLSQLSMKVWHGDTSADPIYNASPDELDGFAESVYLGTFRKGDTTELTVELEVPIDLGNEYKNRVGEVDWVFVAELFDDPTPPPTDNTVVTVRKLWEGEGVHPESIKVDLLCDGEVYEQIELSDKNQWTYTWTHLEDANKWTVEESEVPEGYSVSYETEGNITTIINTKDEIPVEPEPPVEPVETVDLTVVKKWSGDEDSMDERPESVHVTLYNGKEAVETVLLGEWNNWEYTWKDLSSEGDWKVVEVNIPEEYTPAYSANDGVVTITNVASLVQTGQMKWPIPVLSGLGIAMLVFGAVMIARKRKSENV